MILVTLGTHPQPMDRLLRRLDELVAAGMIKDEVIVQSPAIGYRPRRLTVRSVLPFGELTELIARADAVVSHAGPGTLAAIRIAGKVPVVVARSAVHHEHVDDHQERYASRLRERSGYIVCDDLDRLTDALNAARRTAEHPTTPDVSRAIAALEMEARRSGCRS